MSGAMSPASVGAVDHQAGVRKMMPPLPLTDNGGVPVPLPSLQQTTVPVTDGGVGRRSSSLSMEEGGEKASSPPPPAEVGEAADTIVQSPSTSAISASNYLKDQIISFFQVSDNKLAMKLFGNKNALMREKMRQRAVGNWVIHPCSNFRQVFYRTRLS